jgi:MFS family permease
VTPPGRAVLVAALGALVTTLDSAVNIAFPALSAAFAVPVTRIQGVVLAYMGPFTALLVLAGRLGDRLGHARVFRLGLLVSGAALLACALAPSFAALLLARGVQGVGAALLLGTAPALVTLATPDTLRGRALGRFNLVFAAGGVLGPLAAGLLLPFTGWPVVYLGRLPLVALALALAAGLGATPSTPARPGPWPPGFAVADRRTFVLANLANLLAQLALFSVWLLVPYFLIDRRGLSSGTAGLVFAIAPLAWALLTPLGGRLADRRASRWLAPAALAVQALGLGLTAGLGETSSMALIAAALALAGGGMGLFLVPNTHYVMGALPPASQGVAGGLAQLMRTAGIVLGALATTAVYAAQLPARGPAGAFADVFGAMAGLTLVAAVLAAVPPRRPVP